MVILNDKHLLFIEPKSKKMEEPIEDEITKFLDRAMETARPNNDTTKSWHSCACKKAHSDNRTYQVSLGGKNYTTNTLAVHYIRNHRSEVPPEELAKITNAMTKKLKMG